MNASEINQLIAKAHQKLIAEGFTNYKTCGCPPYGAQRHYRKTDEPSFKVIIWVKRKQFSIWRPTSRANFEHITNFNTLFDEIILEQKK